ncbi:hypothetical protein L1987_59915 [Smallanthus sonchifolius]|uniref:Uncharacterized protein n=1 Tax=Smallanthus sonchifolius TaxID=185202 RepID=A0ACB9D714_9ASTR|nr:hypothetical protein L1987_59915 [Smallanthus sonchifolius]
MPSSYGIVDRRSRTLLLLNAGSGDRVDLIIYITEDDVWLQRSYEGIKTVWFDDGVPNKVVRIIFRCNKWSLVTARSSNATLDHKLVRQWASYALLCEFNFLEAFEGAVKKMGKEKDYEGNCVICQEEYKAGDTIGTLEYCKHRYHVECIKNWLMEKV